MHSPWVSRLLSDLGHEVIVAHARNVRLIGESRRKDGRFDARTLARLARIDPDLLGPVQHRSRKVIKKEEVRCCSVRTDIPMPRPIKERIAKLRKEIAQISEANREYLLGGKKPPGAPDHERRLQRLQEIRKELLSLTDWKKP